MYHFVFTTHFRLAKNIQIGKRDRKRVQNERVLSLSYFHMSRDSKTGFWNLYYNRTCQPIYTTRLRTTNWEKRSHDRTNRRGEAKCGIY